MKRLFGIIGILIGALIGVGLYVLVGQFNLFASWVALVSFTASICLYTLFSGKPIKFLAVSLAVIFNCAAMFIGEILDFLLKMSKELDIPFDMLWPNVYGILDELSKNNSLIEILIYPIIGSVLVLISAFFTLKENRSEKLENESGHSSDETN